MLKNNYTGFILWLIGFIILIMVPSFLPVQDIGLLVRIIDNMMSISILILMLIIYRTEKVFWINGISYEQAVEAGSDRRRAYALKYVKLFGFFSAAFLLFSFTAQVLGLPFGIDIGVAAAGIAGCAFYTMKFKL